MLTAGIREIRRLETSAVAGGVPEYLLMCRAGIRAAEWINTMFPHANRVVVLCGGGNNGGDALVAAGSLNHRNVVIYSTAAKEKFSGCAACAVRDLPENIPFYVREKLDRNDFRYGDIIIDGLLGIGFSGVELRESTASFIKCANDSGVPVIALDLPSGINGDSGCAACNGAVKAAYTLTFGAPKPGLFCGDGKRLRGRIRVLDIGLEASSEGFDVFTNIDAVKKLPVWAADCHKNTRGRVLVWGSSPEYPGAAALSVSGALKSGAGMVRCASEADLHCRLCNAAIFQQLVPGESPEKFMSLSDALVCGCGWGKCASREAVRTALQFPGKVVLDADALNFIASSPDCWIKRENIILTPHPGEAARLLTALKLDAGLSRRDAAMALADALQAVILLKGQDSLVAEPGKEPVIIAAGDPILAAAGSGDVLAGVIGALAAQGLDAVDAALLGAYIHGIAGECAGRIITADELPEAIAQAIEKLRCRRIF